MIAIVRARTLISLLVFVTLLANTQAQQNAVAEEYPEDAYTFEVFAQQFHKEYATWELPARKQLFQDNMRIIREQNALYNAGESTWFARVNKFVDMTEEEMSCYRGLKKSPRLPQALSFSEYRSDLVRNTPVDALPASVDWRKHDVVTEVKDQGSCGSCWAFSSAETVESFVALATKKSPPVLAPQQYVDCVQNPNDCGGTGGCSGATQPIAFNYTEKHGLVSEDSYPYTGSDGVCKSNLKPVAGIKGFVVLKPNDWTELMTAVAQEGPIAISVAASAWMFYGGGVFGPNNGCGYDIDHAVQAVGYGVQGEKPYWIVRNSWGADWGESGYIRLYRSHNATAVECGEDTSPGDGFGCNDGPAKIKVCGECGILSYSSYVTGAFLH